MLKRQIRLASTRQPFNADFFQSVFSSAHLYSVHRNCTPYGAHALHWRRCCCCCEKQKRVFGHSDFVNSKKGSHLHSWHYLIRQRALQLCRAVMLSLLCLNHTTRRMFLLKLWILSFINTQIPIFIVCIRSITSDVEICCIYTVGIFFWDYIFLENKRESKFIQ